MAKSKASSRRVASDRESRAEKTKTETPERTIDVRAPMLLAMIVLAALAAGLAIFQWTELLHTQQGGTTFCSIDQTFNCVGVWESPFAKNIHSLTRVPVAGWGLIWALTALGAPAFAYYAVKKKKPAARALAASRVIAFAGLAVSVILFVVTMQIGTFCLTCFATYGLVISYSLFAYKAAPFSFAELSTGAPFAAVLTAGAYLLILYPGMKTPHEAPKLNTMIEQAKNNDPSQPAKKSTGDLLSDFLIQLPQEVQQQVSEALLEYREGTPKTRGTYLPRKVLGNVNSPVQILEWSDIRCGHCKAFSETLETIEQQTSIAAFSLELRQFPLDHGCNPHVNPGMVDETGVRCAAALSLICIEQLPGFRKAQEKMFAAQSTLSKSMVLEYAAGAGMSRADLDACMVSPDTAKKLKDDVDFAMAYGLSGTPLVIINGRETHGYEPFLYALIVAEGDANAPGWSVLPKATGAHRHQH
jgi:serine/threonine-protein kinase